MAAVHRTCDVSPKIRMTMFGIHTTQNASTNLLVLNANDTARCIVDKTRRHRVPILQNRLDFVEGSRKCDRQLATATEARLLLARLGLD